MSTPENKEIHCVCCMQKQQKADMNFQDYCRHVCTLNKDQHHIVIYNRAWCKSYINALSHGEKQEGYRNFLSGPRGDREKVMLYVSYKETCPTFSNTVKPDDDQPVVLITAWTGSAAFQIGGSTIHLHLY